MKRGPVCFFFFFRKEVEKERKKGEKWRGSRREALPWLLRQSPLFPSLSLSASRSAFLSLSATYRTSAELEGLRSRMYDASSARAAPGAGAAASVRATERAADEEEADCPLSRALLHKLVVAPAEPRSPPSATPSPPIGRADMTGSPRESGKGHNRKRG